MTPLTWVVPLQQVPAVEGSAFGVAHLQALLQQPLGDVALADACGHKSRRVISPHSFIDTDVFHAALNSRVCEIGREPGAEKLLLR